MAVTTRNQPIRLNIADEGKQVVVTPEDNDAFVLSVEEAVKACQMLGELQEQFQAQFNHMLRVLGSWSRENVSKLGRAFITLRDRDFLFVVVQKDGKYDDELQDKVSDLVLSIAGDPTCSRIDFDAQILPHCSPEACLSFSNPDWMQEYNLNA